MKKIVFTLLTILMFISVSYAVTVTIISNEGVVEMTTEPGQNIKLKNLKDSKGEWNVVKGNVDIVDNKFEMPNEDVEIEVIYEGTYTIKYNLNGGVVSGTNPKTYTKESGEITLINPTRTGYTFLGWTGSGLSSYTKTVTIPQGSTGNRTYTANWEVRQYSIRFENTGDTVIPEISGAYGMKVIPPSDPTWKGYDFTGWNKEIPTAMGNEDVVISGTWAPIIYNITYDLAGGTVSMQNPPTYKITDTFTLNPPTKRGYTFTGWLGTDLASATENVTVPKGSVGDREYTATWALTPYTITYILNGGDDPGNPTSYKLNTDTFTLTNPKRTGYEFAGWTGTGLNSATKDVAIDKGSTGNRTYTANWEVVTYSITYVLGGGTVSSANPTSYTIETNTFTLNNPTRTGYTFNGWTGTGVTSASSNVSITKGSTGDRTYTAGWTPITYTITYNLDGGSATNPSSYTIETPSFTLNNPTKSGYEFAGWTGTGLNSATKAVAIDKGSSGNREYTATWSGNSYTLTVNPGGTQYTKPYGDSLIISAPEQSYTVAYDANGGSVSTSTANTKSVRAFSSWTLGGDKKGSVSSTESSSITYTYGAGNDTLTANYAGTGNQVTLPTPSRSGYTFNGWHNGSTRVGGAGDKFSPSGNVSLIASWTVNNVTVTFYANNGTNTSTTQSITIDQATVLNAMSFSAPSGYSFDGWNTAANGTGTPYRNQQSVTIDKNLTLYARWYCSGSYTCYGITEPCSGGTRSQCTVSGCNGGQIVTGRCTESNDVCNTCGGSAGKPCSGTFVQTTQNTLKCTCGKYKYNYSCNVCEDATTGCTDCGFDKLSFHYYACNPCRSKGYRDKCSSHGIYGPHDITTSCSCGDGYIEKNCKHGYGYNRSHYYCVSHGNSSITKYSTHTVNCQHSNSSPHYYN